MRTLKLIAFAILAFFNVAKANDTVYVSQDKLTHIKFDQQIASINPVKGTLMFEVKGQAVALKTQASEFVPTDLVVNTVDGKQYNFDVIYSYGRAGKHVNAVYSEKNTKSRKVPVEELSLAEKFRKQKRIKTIDKASTGKVKAKVAKILVSGDSLFFKLHLENRSNINYDINFIRFYVRDLKTAKRTVTQERELYPVESFGTRSNTVKSGTYSNYVYTLKKFPLSKDRGLFIEIYEKNGGRHLYLKIKQKDISRAKSIQSIFN